MHASKHSWRVRRTRVAIALSIGVVVSIVAAEFALRFFLFDTSRFAIEHGQRVRDVGFFGDRQSDDEVWKLEWLMNDAGRLHDAPNADPKHGWLDTIDRHGYGHPDRLHLNGRRAVLLYGDSFAHGNTPRAECFQSILERSSLGTDHALLNFGVGGYGLDQTWLLLRESIDHYAELDPIVAIGVFVDDDIDRCVLSFRCWPKPRFTVVDGELQDAEPVTTDIREYLDHHPLGIRSYLWRFLKYRRRVLPRVVQVFLRGDDRHIDEKKKIARAILVALHRDLEARHIRHFVLGFLGENALLGDRANNWQEPFLEATCREIALPLVSTRPYFEAAAHGDRLQMQSFFGGSPQLNGHYNATGNLVAFEALRAGLEGRFDTADVSRASTFATTDGAKNDGANIDGAKIGEATISGANSDRAQSRVTTSGGANVVTPIEESLTLFDRIARVSKLRAEVCLRTVDEANTRTVYVRGTDLGPTTLSIDLEAAVRAFDAKLEWARPQRECRSSGARVVVTVDGREVLTRSIDSSSSTESIRVDTTAAHDISITVWAPHDDVDCCWVCFVDAHFE